MCLIFPSDTGIVFYYTTIQACVWLALHAFFLFWGVAFPFNYREFKLTKKLKHLHAVSIVLGLTVPLPAALVPIKDGFIVPTTGLVLLCIGQDIDINFYTFILPLSILIAFTSILLNLMFCILFKVQYIMQVVINIIALHAEFCAQEASGWK